MGPNKGFNDFSRVFPKGCHGMVLHFRSFSVPSEPFHGSPPPVGKARCLKNQRDPFPLLVETLPVWGPVVVGDGGELDTPPETNMEPENGGPLEKEIPIGNHHFQVPAVNFWGYTPKMTPYLKPEAHFPNHRRTSMGIFP